MVRSKGVCPHSVCRIIVGLCSVFVPIFLCRKSKSHHQTHSAVDPLGSPSDSSPVEEGGSEEEEEASPSGPLFLQGQKAPDPEVASHSWHPRRMPIHASTASSQLSWRRRPFWSVGFLSITLRPLECDSWNRGQELGSPSAQYHLVLGGRVRGPTTPPFHPGPFRG